jgi:hypothetical protein
MRQKVIALVVTLAVAAGIGALLKYGPSAGTAGERGLVLYLPLGKDFDDHSPFRRKVEVSGKVRLENGVAHFPGDGWLTVEHIPLDGRAFAVSMWVKPETAKGSVGLLDQKDEDSENRHLHLALSVMRPYFAFYANDTRSRRYLAYGRWSHLVFVFTGERQEVWVDGSPIERSASKPYLGKSGDTVIGRRLEFPYLRATDFEGWMCEVRIYEGPFEGERVAALYRRGMAGK